MHGSSLDKPLHRGGIRQRQAWSTAQHAATTPGQLSRLLLEKRAWGELASSTIQEIAAAAVADGACCSYLERLANSGSSGKHSNNCERDINNMLKPNLVSQCLKPVMMPVLNPWQIVNTEHLILYPHEVFAALYCADQRVFIDRFCGNDEGSIERFWNAMAGHPSMENHPMLEHHNWQRTFIPLQLHGDGDLEQLYSIISKCSNQTHPPHCSDYCTF